MAEIERMTFEELMDFEDSNTISIGGDLGKWRSETATLVPATLTQRRSSAKSPTVRLPKGINSGQRTSAGRG